MRKVILTLMASLLSCSTVSAFWPEAVASSLEIGVGYRNDEITRKTGSSNSNSYSGYSSSSSSSDSVNQLPSFRDKIKYKNLNIVEIEANGKYVTCDDIYLRACGDYGWITSGKIHRDNIFTDTFSNLGDSSSSYGFGGRRNDHVKGHVYDAKIAAGYLFHLCDDSFAIAPVIGYSWHGQHLRQSRHNEDSSYSSYDSSYSSYSSDYYSSYGSGSDNGTRSRYNTRWNGPFVGFDADYKFMCDWSIFGGYEFHWACFHAKGRDTLFQSLIAGTAFNGVDNRFHQRSERAYGHVLDVGFKYDLCECWTLSVKGQFQWWTAHHGHQRVKIAETDFSGSTEVDCYYKSRIKKVEWCTAGVVVDAGMVF